MAGQPTARTTPDLNRLNQAQADLAYVARWLVPSLDTLNLLRSPLQGTDYDRTGGGTDIPDPTPNQGAHAHYDTDHREIRARVRLIAHLTRLLAAQIARVPVTDDERSRRELQCTGGLDGGEYDGWERYCEAYYERRQGENARLCAACIRRKNRWQQDHRELATA